MRRVLIMGAAGRDFHDFNTVYRADPGVEVVAFTATQIPFIDDRRYPPELAGKLYPDGIQIHPETQLDHLIRDLDQAALYGTLNRILSLGFELIELRRLTGSANQAGPA